MATKTTATSKAATRTSSTKATTTPAAKAQPAIERKALAMDSKSDGMRLLYDNGYTVAQVKAVYNAPYGFAYGVALRYGVIATAATRRQPAKAKVTKVASKRPTAKARTASTTSATTRVAAKIAAKQAPVAKAKGRPTAARRAANRKAQVSA